MNYDLDADQATETVRVTVSCELDQDLRKEILIAVAEKLKEQGYSRAIIDVTRATFNAQEPMTGAMELTAFMTAIGIEPETKLAFIYAEAEKHRKFFEAVAQLDGYSLKYFKSLSAAMEWLLA